MIEAIKGKNIVLVKDKEEFLKKLDKDFDTGFRGQYKQGGTTNDYVDVDLTPEEIKDLIAQGYVIEEHN